MATEIFRKKFLTAYRESRDADLFLSGFFEVREDNISDTEKVAIDIERTDEEISPIVQTCEGSTANKSIDFTTKEFTPPTINESMAFNCKELLKRLPGETEPGAVVQEYWDDRGDTSRSATVWSARPLRPSPRPLPHHPAPRQPGPDR